MFCSCRFLLGGDHGRLKYIPPDEFSPLVECLLPQQVLSIDPCFYFGNLSKVVLAGPWPVEDDTAFVPTPVDTSMVSYSCHSLSCCYWQQYYSVTTVLQGFNCVLTFYHILQYLVILLIKDKTKKAQGRKYKTSQDSTIKQ